MKIWKKLKHFNNYLISNDGKIYSLKSKKIMKPNSCGQYYIIFLSQNNISKKLYIHRLVAQTFIPNPHHKKVVNHINGIKTDNRVENLEWSTQKENVQHALKMGLIKRSNEHKKIVFKTNKRFYLKRTTNKQDTTYYKDIYEASRLTGMSIPYINYLISTNSFKNEKWEIVK